MSVSLHGPDPPGPDNKGASEHPTQQSKHHEKMKPGRKTKLYDVLVHIDRMKFMMFNQAKDAVNIPIQIKSKTQAELNKSCAKLVLLE